SWNPLRRRSFPFGPSAVVAILLSKRNTSLRASTSSKNWVIPECAIPSKKTWVTTHGLGYMVARICIRGCWNIRGAIAGRQLPVASLVEAVGALTKAHSLGYEHFNTFSSIL